MRRIKFRVWDKKQKTYEHKFPYNSLGQFYVSESGKVFSDFGNSVAPEVRQGNFIVEQYTGLKDKNGKEIYEGDIVGIPDNKEDGIEAHVFGAVVYDKNKFGVKRESPFAGEDIHFFDIWDGLEVIGNIHQNGDLLKGK